MNIDFFFSEVPFWGLFVFTAVTILLSLSVGFRLGSYTAKRSELDKNAPIVPVISAMLGLLAFMLAFTFGMASSLYTERNRLLLDEVNVIRTTYMNADFLEKSKGFEIQRLLREYVKIQANLPLQSKKIYEAVSESEAILDQVWSHSVEIGQTSPNRIFGMFLKSLNEVFVFHSKRVTMGLQYRIPGMVWLTLIIVTILAMLSVGYQFGLSGRRSFHVRLVVAITFGAVLVLITDLNRPTEGSIKTNQTPMIELQHELNTSKH
jgi:hypothetical protein